MQTTTLGSLDVSRICLGTMTWGQQNTQEQGFAQMDFALEQGVFFWDTAEMYAVPPQAQTYGATEKVMGAWFAERQKRDQVVLATKVIGQNPAMNWIRAGKANGFGSPESLQQACEDSLRRLQTDYVDLYQLHWPERQANYFGRLGFSVAEQEAWTEEAMVQTLRTLDHLLKQGKIRMWGLSNETAWGIMKYLRLADELGIARPVSVQNPYSLLNRSAEVGVAEVCYREHLHFMAYSVLGMGMLTGKYDHQQSPAGARLTLFKDYFLRYSSPQAVEAAALYNQLARDHGWSPTQLALAYVHHRKWMGSTIVGATSVEQLHHNLEAFSLDLSEEICQEIDKIHQQYPYPAP